jgi:hypothetical protein
LTERVSLLVNQIAWGCLTIWLSISAPRESDGWLSTHAFASAFGSAKKAELSGTRWAGGPSTRVA